MDVLKVPGVPGVPRVPGVPKVPKVPRVITGLLNFTMNNFKYS
jgi:hypothetical protein